MSLQPKIKLVVSDLTTEQLEYYSSRDIIAVDCEMMGLNIHRDRLCLVQIGDADKVITLVQIELGQKTAPNLAKLFSASTTVKLFHFARTDVAWLKFWLGIEVNNIFCTKIASKLARTYTDKHGLKDLCKEVTGKELNKNQQSSDWGSFDINKDQIQYAANDVINLIEVYLKLKIMLEREGRMELAIQCSGFVPVLAEMDSLGYQSILEH